MDSLGLPRFGAFGWSLGGQYALALGAGLPYRVSAVVVVAGCLPMNPDRISEVNRTDRTILRLSSDHPRVARRTFRVMGAYGASVAVAAGAGDVTCNSPRPTGALLQKLPDGSASRTGWPMR